MSKSTRLRLADVRALLQLVGECRDLGDDPIAWRRHFSGFIARLTSADMVFLGSVHGGRDGKLLNGGMAHWGLENFNAHVLAQTMDEKRNDMKHAPHIGAYFAQARQLDGACLPRKALVADREWYGSWYYECIHAPLGIEHILTCFTSLPGKSGEYSGTTVCRDRRARQDFRSRDLALVREAHAAVAPLIGGPLASFADPSPGALAPRVRQVLRCLLEGDGDKQAARRLGISRFTVNQYTKAIYRHFGVGGRAELLARWVRRGWGSQGWWEGPA